VTFFAAQRNPAAVRMSIQGEVPDIRIAQFATFSPKLRPEVGDLHPMHGRLPKL
jgi:hypothetical protein